MEVAAINQQLRQGNGAFAKLPAGKVWARVEVKGTAADGSEVTFGKVVLNQLVRRER